MLTLLDSRAMFRVTLRRISIWRSLQSGLFALQPRSGLPSWRFRIPVYFIWRLSAIAPTERLLVGSPKLRLSRAWRADADDWSASTQASRSRPRIGELRTPFAFPPISIG